MLDQVLSLFDIRPDYDLNIMRHDQTLAQVTAGALTELDAALRAEKPDWVLIAGRHDHGDGRRARGFLSSHPQSVTSKPGFAPGINFSLFPKRSTARSPTPCAICISPRPKIARENLLREGVDARERRCHGQHGD